MNKKYELIASDSIYRIKALKNFYTASGELVEIGDIGGFVDSEYNLSQEGCCWISHDARVLDNARVKDDAFIGGYSNIYDSAEISGRAIVTDSVIHDFAKVSERAIITNNSRVKNKAKVRGWCLLNMTVVSDMADIFGHCSIRDSHIRHYSLVSGSVKIENSEIYNTTTIYGGLAITNSSLTGNCKILDDASIFGSRLYDAIIKESQKINGTRCYGDISKNLKENIRCQTNLLPEDDYVIAYKIVDKDMSSFYDPNFVYKVGTIVEVKNPEESDKSCASGLHFSNPNYWTHNESEGYLLKAKIMLDDIITVQSGKIRCRRAEILAAYPYDIPSKEEI